MKTPILLILCALVLAGCGVNRSAFSPGKKYSPADLQEDYRVYRTVLEEHHPGIYWYTGKDSMDYYFEKGRQQLSDSLTEPEFRKVLNYVTAKIDCGHTAIRPSKTWNKYSDTAKLGKMFPLSFKIWEDAMVVTTNLNRRDTVLKRGTVITKINGKTKAELVDTLFQYIPTDGHNRTNKFQSLSNRGYFSSLYTSLYGLSEKYTIEYRDNNGLARTINIPVYNPAADTAGRTGTRPFRPATAPTKKELKELRLNSVRLLKIDTANRSAMMDLASFGRGYGLKRFFRNSFQVLQESKISHLIIDVRSNGGGSVSNSTNATRYLVDHKFKLADSLYAVRKHGTYDRTIENHFWYNLFISFLTKKRSDGNFHFGYFERHYFQPKRTNHYNGKVYLLTGGNSFSATTLFTSALVKQGNIIVVGEETGGGAYGNSAWLIPDVKLPNTGVRFRLPLFKLVIDKTVPMIGRGVQPEIESFPTVDAVRRNIDYKLEKAMELIRKDQRERKIQLDKN